MEPCGSGRSPEQLPGVDSVGKRGAVGRKTELSVGLGMWMSSHVIHFPFTVGVSILLALGPNVRVELCPSQAAEKGGFIGSCA